MQDNSPNFSIQEMMRIAQSPAGKQLLALLKQSDPSDLKRATQLASSGNMEQAKQILQHVLGTEEGKQLMQQLGDGNG